MTYLIRLANAIRWVEERAGIDRGRELASIDEALVLGEGTTGEEALALAAQIAHADEERRC